MQRLEVSCAVRRIYIYMSLGAKIVFLLKVTMMMVTEVAETCC